MTQRIEAQIERFAPGFKDCVLMRKTSSPADLEAMDANLVGGDISGGAMTVRQFLFRPKYSELRHGDEGALFVLVFDASRGRSARDVRCERGAAGAATGAMNDVD